MITGASSGLGKALSHALSKRGSALILTARDKEKLSQAALDLPSSTELICCDLSDPQDRKNLVQVIRNKQPDLVINNAGFGLYGPAHTHPFSELEKMVETNIQAVVELSTESTRAWLESGKKGTVLNISSAAAFVPYPNFCVYAATKAFVNSFTQGLDQEMKKHGIRALTVCPGQIDTNFRKVASGNFPQKTNSITMPAATAAELILEQLDNLKPLSIIDWRSRIAVNLSRLLPKRLVQAALERNLKGRYR
jgi:uncharacterized protein